MDLLRCCTGQSQVFVSRADRLITTIDVETFFSFFSFLSPFQRLKIFLKFLKNKNVSTNVTRNSTLMLFSCRFLRYFKRMGNTTWKNYNARSTDSNTVCRKLRHFTSTDDGFRHVFF